MCDSSYAASGGVPLMEHRPPAAATRCRTPRRVASAAAAGSRTSRTVTPVSDMHKPYAAASATCARRICDSTAAAGRCRTRRAGSQASERAHVTQRSFAVESCLLTRSEPAAVTAGLRDASLPPAHGAQHPPPVAPPPLPAAAARWHQAPVVAIGSPAAAALRAEERGDRAGRRARPRAPQQQHAAHSIPPIADCGSFCAILSADAAAVFCRRHGGVN
jgi:hypothetical protein